MTNIDDKTQDAEKIPQKLTGPCNVCNKKDATFVYIGRKNSKLTKPLDFYNCSNCEATYVLDSLLNKHGAKYELKDLISPQDFKESLSRKIEQAKIRALFSA